MKENDENPENKPARKQSYRIGGEGGFIIRQKVKRVLSSCNMWEEEDARYYHGGGLCACWGCTKEGEDMEVKVKTGAKQGCRNESSAFKHRVERVKRGLSSCMQWEGETLRGLIGADNQSKQGSRAP